MSFFLTLRLPLTATVRFLQGERDEVFVEGDQAVQDAVEIELEGKRHIVVPDFDRLLEETGDDSDGGMLV